MGVNEDRRRIIAAQPHLVTASGSAVLVNIAEPKIERLRVTFAPVQTGSGTPSPSNVRPIMGWATIAASIGTMPVGISLGGTYYGGTVDLVSGVMTVTQVKESFVWGVGYVGERVRTNCRIRQWETQYRPLQDPDTGITDERGSKCDIATWNFSYTQDAIHYYTYYGSQGVGCAYLTLPNNAASDTQFSICYDLHDPFTVTLTPQTLTALRGQQTVTSPAGAVEISYWTN